MLLRMSRIPNPQSLAPSTEPKSQIPDSRFRIPKPESRVPYPGSHTFSSASSRSRMMSCQSSRPMERRMPSGRLAQSQRSSATHVTDRARRCALYADLWTPF